ncbi:AAA family ATPase [candidate division WOR-3 bacterium]|nr:AAA family ATPase [candidate division WOR-3 bacterium]
MPGFIAQKYSEGVKSGFFEAAVLFTDISGFTEMTSKLMGRGKEGIEILTLTINEVFSPAISVVRTSGGFISVFGGDAFYAIFGSENANFRENAIYAGQRIAQIFREQGLKKTKGGTFSLSVKTGISIGEIQWGIIENPRQNSYYFKGNPVDLAAQAQNHCPKNSVSIDKSLKRSLKNFKFKKIRPLAYAPLFTINTPRVSQTTKNCSEQVSKLFFPSNLLERNLMGEFREVASVFMSFMDTELVKDNISRVIDLVHETGGYFNRISYGDKGGFLLVFYGAPEGREMLCERAVKMSLSASEIPRFLICTGISFGMCFSGFSGSEKRAEYTCQGEKVNLAARLMSYKSEYLPPQPRILVENSIFQKLKDAYIFDKIGESVLKGFKDPMPIFSLRGEEKKKIPGTDKSGFVGRGHQLSKNLKMLEENLNKNHFGGIVKIEGEAGVGKSFFVSEIKEKTSYMQWISISCDQIYRYSLNPLKQFLGDFFIFDQTQSNEDKISSMKGKIESLFSGKDAFSIFEMEKMLYIFSDFLGIKSKSSPYGDLDLKNKKAELFYFIKSIIKKMSLRSPLVIFIDDIHWIDTDTLEFIKTLCRNVENYPFAVILTSRPSVDGNRIDLFEEEDCKNIKHHFIHLGPLSQEDSYDLIKKFLKQKNIPGSTLEFVQKKSEGNPFYIKQTLSFLLENNLLDENFRISYGSAFIPSGIRAILVSRFDKFNEDLKQTVVKASVLGFEFQLETLKKMNLENDLVKLLTDGEKNGIWSPSKKGFYEFSHSLIRETVYEMQLLTERRKLHLQAATIYEDLEKDQSAKYTSIIAYHYDLAEDRDNAPKYLKKALELAEKAFSNSDSLRFCEALDKYLPGGSEKIRNCLRRVQLLKLTGSLKRAEVLAEKTIVESEKEDLPDLTIKCLLALSEISLKRFEFEKSFEALKKSEKIQTVDENLKAYIHEVFGIYFHGINNEEKALPHFKRALSFYRRTKNKSGEAKVLSNIAILCGREIGFSNVLTYLFDAQKIAEETGNLYDLEIIYSSIALTYTELYLELEKSLEFYHKAIEISQKIGNKSTLMNNINNMANVYLAVYQHTKAEQLYRDSLDLALETGRSQGIFNSLMNLSILYKDLGDFDRCVEHIEKAESLLSLEYNRDLLKDVFTLKTEVLSLKGDFVKAEKNLDRIKDIEAETQSEDNLEELALLKMRISFLKNPDQETVKAMISSAKKINSLSSRARAFYSIWESTKSKDSAEEALKLYNEIIEMPPDVYQNFKSAEYLKIRNELERFLGKFTRPQEN